MKKAIFQSNIIAMDTVSQIKERLDLIDFLKGYLTLTSAGKNYKAACPFHKEKSPSFIASPERQIWHCFGCGAGGDIIGFLMRYENIEFIEALKILAEKAGVDFQRQGTSDQKQYVRLYHINQAAKDFFQAHLRNHEQAKAYLLERGLKSEIIEGFDLGFAPDGTDNLLRHLTGKGFNITEIERAGLIFKTDRGRYYDRFRSRIMFPIHNHFGKVVGFTGRILPQQTQDREIAKYVNSPETPIFNKSKILFGFNETKNSIREKQEAVLVEGQMDFLMCWQAGVKNIVATSGTAMTEEHLKVLKRMAETLVLAFDADEAGQMAAERTIDMAQAMDFSVKIFTIDSPQLKDPADVAQKNPALLGEYIQKAKPIMQYYLDRYISPEINDVPTAKKNLRIILSKIKLIYSPIEKSRWLKELAIRTGIDEKVLYEEMELLKAQAVEREAVKKDVKPQGNSFSRKDLISQRILSLVSIDQNFIDKVSEIKDFLPAPYRDIFNSLNAGTAVSAEAANIATLVSMRSSLDVGHPPEKASEELRALLRQLKMEHYKEKQRIIGEEIKKAEKSGDETALSAALKEFDFIAKELQNVAIGYD